MEQNYIYKALALCRIKGNDYGGITAYCRLCTVPAAPYSGTVPLKIYYSEGGNPIDIILPIVNHLVEEHGITHPHGG